MPITNITTTSIYVTDQAEALDFYVGKLGFVVDADIDLGVMRWLTVTVPGSGQNVLLERPGPPSMDDGTAAQVRELLAKGATGGTLFLACDDAHAEFARLKEAGVEVIGEPTDMPYGIDFGLRDPFGNHLRIAQLHAVPRDFSEMQQPA